MPILVLLAGTDEAQAAEYIVAGADGCVMENSSIVELRSAIGRVIKGQAFCSEDMIHLPTPSLPSWHANRIGASRWRPLS